MQAARLLTGLLSLHPSGCVRFSQGKVTRRVWFDSGHVRAITSTLLEEKLGSWLTARDLIDRRSLHDLLAAAPKDMRLGELLVERHYLSSEVLERELDTLTLRLAAKLALEGGSYELDTSAILQANTVAVNYDPLTLLVTAVRRVPDTGQFEALTGGALMWAAVPPSEPGGLAIEPVGAEKLLLQYLDTPRSLVDLRTTVPQHAVELPRALASLVVQGRVQESGGARQPFVQRGKPVYPPASPRVRQLLAELDPNPTRKVAGPTVPTAPGKGAPLDPELAEQYKRQAYGMLEAGGDPRTARKLLSQAVEVAPDATALTVLAELELHNPLWRPRALERLKQATSLAPQHTGAWLALANYWSLRFQPDKQRRCLEKVLSYEPRNEEARKTLELLGPDR